MSEIEDITFSLQLTCYVSCNDRLKWDRIRILAKTLFYLQNSVFAISISFCSSFNYKFTIFIDKTGIICSTSILISNFASQLEILLEKTWLETNPWMPLLEYYTHIKSLQLYFSVKKFNLVMYLITIKLYTCW